MKTGFHRVLAALSLAVLVELLNVSLYPVRKLKP